ncbi:hypothetical protein Lal_00011357 [Lupinus albus]|nr:hypothetical protein Lal_00011357 [Lupinus albus]
MRRITNDITTILVNGNPTKDIHLHRGTAKNLFTPYRVGIEDVCVPLLQLSNDAILIRECSEHNILVMKSILWLFELASRLNVNFTKSKLVGLNVHKDYIDTFSNFLNCKVTLFGLPSSKD